MTTEIKISGIIYQIIVNFIVENWTRDTDIKYIPEYIIVIKKYIEKNFRNEISLTYLENKYNRSKYSISKEFKKYMGITVGEFIISTMLSHAKVMLKDGEENV